jgi:hypothetical protein
MAMITTPRNNISIQDKIPARWSFISCQRGYEYAMKAVMQYIDTVAEHADALMGANGLTPSCAVETAIKDLIKMEKEEYSSGDYWKLTPTHRKAIIKWLEAA